MGYDDNTPLTGVTGGGLPAEIWREVMLRVHEGLPVRPLPMAAPGRAGDSSVAESPGTPAPQPQPQAQQPAPQNRDRGGDVAERILLEVLNGLLRGN
jgi:membrane peptidoglycan carboxypeptidase